MRASGIEQAAHVNREVGATVSKPTDPTAPSSFVPAAVQYRSRPFIGRLAHLVGAHERAHVVQVVGALTH